MMQRTSLAFVRLAADVEAQLSSTWSNRPPPMKDPLVLADTTRLEGFIRKLAVPVPASCIWNVLGVFDRANCSTTYGSQNRGV